MDILCVPMYGNHLQTRITMVCCTFHALVTWMLLRVSCRFTHSFQQQDWLQPPEQECVVDGILEAQWWCFWRHESHDNFAPIYLNHAAPSPCWYTFSAVTIELSGRQPNTATHDIIVSYKLSEWTVGDARCLFLTSRLASHRSGEDWWCGARDKGITSDAVT